MTRPPARDQPSPEESAVLLAELGDQLAAAADRAGAQIVFSPDRTRQVRVRPQGPRTQLSLVEHGQLLGRGEVETTDLIEVLSGQGAAAFDTLSDMITSR